MSSTCVGTHVYTNTDPRPKTFANKKDSALGDESLAPSERLNLAVRMDMCIDLCMDMCIDMCMDTFLYLADGHCVEAVHLGARCCGEVYLGTGDYCAMETCSKQSSDPTVSAACSCHVPSFVQHGCGQIVAGYSPTKMPGGRRQVFDSFDWTVTSAACVWHSLC